MYIAEPVACQAPRRILKHGGRICWNAMHQICLRRNNPSWAPSIETGDVVKKAGLKCFDYLIWHQWALVLQERDPVAIGTYENFLRLGIRRADPEFVVADCLAIRADR